MSASVYATVLTVGLQPGPYTVLEFNSGSIDVCFEIESGVLDIPVTPAVRLFTQDVSATGMRPVEVLGESSLVPRLSDLFNIEKQLGNEARGRGREVIQAK